MSIGGPGGVKAGMDRAASTALLAASTAFLFVPLADELAPAPELQPTAAPPRATAATPPIARRPPPRMSARRVSAGPWVGRPSVVPNARGCPWVPSLVVTVLGLGLGSRASRDAVDELEELVAGSNEHCRSRLLHSFHIPGRHSVVPFPVVAEREQQVLLRAADEDRGVAQ